MLQEACQTKSTFDLLWGSLVLVSLGTQVQSQIIFDPDYFPDYLSVSYKHGKSVNGSYYFNKFF